MQMNFFRAQKKTNNFIILFVKNLLEFHKKNKNADK